MKGFVYVLLFVVVLASCKGGKVSDPVEKQKPCVGLIQTVLLLTVCHCRQRLQMGCLTILFIRICVCAVSN